MSAHKDDFNKWIEMWDKSQKDFVGQEPAERKVNLGGFFGLQQANNLDSVPTDDASHWRDVLDRSRELFDSDDSVITEQWEVVYPPKKSTKNVVKEEKSEGFGKDLSSGPGKDVKFHVNPVKFNSVGRDQDLRVTKNWIDGEELVELARLKSMLYALESDFLRADTLGEKTDSIKKRLEEIQNKCHELSERLTPDPKTDVT